MLRCVACMSYNAVAQVPNMVVADEVLLTRTSGDPQCQKLQQAVAAQGV